MLLARAYLARLDRAYMYDAFYRSKPAWFNAPFENHDHNKYTAAAAHDTKGKREDELVITYSSIINF